MECDVLFCEQCVNIYIHVKLNTYIIIKSGKQLKSSFSLMDIKNQILYLAFFMCKGTVIYSTVFGR